MSGNWKSAKGISSDKSKVLATEPLPNIHLAHFQGGAAEYAHVFQWKVHR